MKSNQKHIFFSGIFVKLLLISFFTSFIIFLSLFAYSSNMSKQSLKEQVLLHTNLLNKRTEQYLDLYFNNIDNILLLIAQNETLFDNQNEVVIKNMLDQYNLINTDIINNIFVVFPDGKVISSSQLFYNIIGHDYLNELYQKAFDNHGAINWSEPYYSKMLAKRTVAFMKPVTNKAGKQICVVIIEVNLTLMTNQFKNIISNENQTFIITTGSNNLVSADLLNPMIPCNLHVYPVEIKEDFFEELKTLSNGIGRIEYDGKNLMAVKSVNTKMGWNLIVLIEESFLNKDIDDLYRVYIRMGLLFTFILFIIYFIISIGFSKPIYSLAKYMDNIEEDVLQNTKSINFKERKDEIGRLYISFNNMLLRIQKLMREQRESEQEKRSAELKALQKQIKPHFLCNTLACIKSLSLQNRTAEVQDSITDLIYLLHFMIGKSGEHISLEEELTFIDHYVSIQKMRYGDVFDFKEQIDCSYREYNIPRLLIQPIVENAIFHGLRGNPGRRGLITIRIVELGTTFHIFIEDNGVGIDNPILKELQTLLNKTNAKSEEDRNTKDDGFPEDAIGGISLINIQNRIKLFYGEEYGMYISSKIDQGTRVELCLPKQSRKEYPF